MSWSTPPTFVDGTLPTDAELNIVRNDIAYLYELFTANGAIAFNGISSNVDLSADNNSFTFIHVHRWLHYHVELESGEIQDFIIVYNGVDVYEDATNRTAPYIYDGVIDLEDTGVISPTPTIGEEYVAYFAIDFTAGTNEVHVQYLIEHPEATL